MKSFYHQIIIIWHIYGEWHLNLVNRLKRNCQTWTGRKRFLPSQSITNEVKNNSTVIRSRFGNKFKFGAPNGTAELIGSLFWITMICSCLSVSCLYGACVCFFFLALLLKLSAEMELAIANVSMKMALSQWTRWRSTRRPEPMIFTYLIQPFSWPASPWFGRGSFEIVEWFDLELLELLRRLGRSWIRWLWLHLSTCGYHLNSAIISGWKLSSVVFYH